MKIFIDTANLDEIREAVSWGILDGVTTNPSLVKKAVEKLKSNGKKISMEDYIKEICRAVDGPVSLEVKGVSYEDMVREAKILHDKFNGINNNVVVKIPVNTSFELNQKQFEGIKAIKELESMGIKTNATLVMSPEQALLAAKANASYVSPFLGRIDDYIRKKIGIKHEKMDYWDYESAKIIEYEMKKSYLTKGYEKLAGIEYHDNGIYSGIDLAESIIKIFRAYSFKTKIIAASIRNARQVRQIAMLGVDIATIPFAVIKEMIAHYKTMEGMKKFTNDVVEEYRQIFE